MKQARWWRCAVHQRYVRLVSDGECTDCCGEPMTEVEVHPADTGAELERLRALEQRARDMLADSEHRRTGEYDQEANALLHTLTFVLEKTP